MQQCPSGIKTNPFNVADSTLCVFIPGIPTAAPSIKGLTVLRGTTFPV